MLEQPSRVGTEKSVPKEEMVSEQPPHLDVAILMKEKNAFFVHAIQVTDALDVSENNKSLNTKRLSIADKLDLLYGTNPTLSASTLRPHTNDGMFTNGFGVVFSHGKIVSAHPADAGTVALSHKERHVIGKANAPEDIERAIDRPQYGDQKTYNEIVLKDPEVCGGFMKMSNLQDRISYEEGEITHYDGEKEVTRTGVVDFSNPVDRFGRPTGVNFDKPLAVLVEMSKRGRVFFMDDANQMYIIKEVDEKGRRIGFNPLPMTPEQVQFHYGKERMNPYNKKEMADRLENSLKEKGMTLH